MIEQTILRNLILNEDYSRKVLPYLKDVYFHDPADLALFQVVSEYTIKFNKLPNWEVVKVELSQRHGFSDDTFKRLSKNIEELQANTEVDNIDWLVESTEKFCKSKALYNALILSNEIIQQTGKSKLSEGSIPGIMSDALSITFNPNLGLDYLESFEERYDYFHSDTLRLPFDIEILNKITNGGVKPSTLQVLMSPPGSGKTLFMCHMAAAYMNMGYNVLYITLEMGKQEISQRIDANVLNLTLNDLNDVSKMAYLAKAEDFKAKAKHLGKLIVEEFPTAGASVIHFKSLVNDLKIKRNFIPDVIFVDYLNICASARIGHGSKGGLYEYVGSIAQELRGMAQELIVPIWTAVQPNRSGFSDSDLEMDQVSESAAIPAIADLFLAIIATEDLIALSQLLVKQLKNRYSDMNLLRRFVVGVDRAKMRIYDVEQVAQENLMGKEKTALKPDQKKPEKKGLELLF